VSFYSLSQRTTATATNTPSWEIRSASVNKPKVIELGLVQVTAVAGQYGVGRPGAIGVTPTAPQTFVTESDAGAPAGLTTGALAWGTAPTQPTFFDKRASPAAAVGQGIIWTWPRGFDLLVSSSVIIWIVSTAPVCDVWAVVEE
jgi:hypothetical protein